MADGIGPLAAALEGRRLFVLVGAGCSTESGIPDYRSRGIVRPPLDHRAFVSDPEVRRRYWARSFHGWPRISGAAPNPAHRALAALERAGIATGPVTQNVDGLHQAAGSVEVIELHGALREVVCLGCGAREPRAAVQDRMAAANGAPDAVTLSGADPRPPPAEGRGQAPGTFAWTASVGWNVGVATVAEQGTARRRAAAAGWNAMCEHRPMGLDRSRVPSRFLSDVQAIGRAISAEHAPERFVVPACLRCDGALKPAVVLFGDNVPRPTVDAAYARLDRAGAVLVVGSSLTVFSGYRFVKRAADRGLPVAIVNRGPTRADPLAAITVDGLAGEILPALAAALGAATTVSCGPEVPWTPT